MSDNKSTETPANDAAANKPAPGASSPDPAPSGPTFTKGSDDSATSGPTFTKGSDPLAGVKKGASDALASMEGKTVSMKVYVGSIIGVILLMLLARCGG
ncbi:MAG: hypothetical protein WBM54_15700 [Woeseia sp.]